MAGGWVLRTPNARRREPKRNTRCLRVEQFEARLLMTGDLRSIDGTGNNLANGTWGTPGTLDVRLAGFHFEDGFSTPAGANLPSARVISNAVSPRARTPDASARFLTDLAWAWGQFVTHDIHHITTNPAESFEIPIPQFDPEFDVQGTGTRSLAFSRYTFAPGTGTDAANPRQYANEVTAFLDGSVVYGSDTATAAALRTLQGGKLQTSAGNLLPWDNSAARPGFLAGDDRVNENVLLISLTTLFFREHNRLADELAATDFAQQDLSDPAVDEAIYQRARSLVVAQIQAITYQEFLPALLGESLPVYAGYDPSVQPAITTEFAAAAFRIGHSMVSRFVRRVDADGNITGGMLVRDSFFNPTEITTHGIDGYLRGGSLHVVDEIDPLVTTELRDWLFGDPERGGLDLLAMDLQRGRDQGLATYNQVRASMGLQPVTQFSQISSNPQIVATLQDAYTDVDSIELFVGGLAETHLPGSSLGETFTQLIVDQFEQLRVADRFYYEHQLSGAELQMVRNTTLDDVIKRNTGGNQLAGSAFFGPQVMVYQIPDGTLDPAFTFAAAGATLEVTSASGVHLTAADATTESVVIRGPRDPHGVGIQLVLDLESVTAQEFDIRLRPQDTLELRATNGDDTVIVRTGELSLGDKNVRLFGNGQLNVFGRDGDDTLELQSSSIRVELHGDAGDDLLIGGPGHDVLRGGAGNDQLFGNDGFDLLDGGPGNDLLDGGIGNDRLLGGDGRDGISGGPGRDLLWGGADADDLDGGGNNDLIWAGPGDDRALGGPGSDRIFGEDGHDLLDGQEGHDFVYGQAGDDTLIGGVGRDMLMGGPGADTAFGGGNNDFLHGGMGPDQLSGGPGSDTIFGGGDRDVLLGGDGRDRLFGGTGDDLILGEAGADVIYGGAGDNWLDGGADNDLLFGSGGQDVLVGGPGLDQALGGYGLDWLLGSEDDDLLRGGAGNDFLLGNQGLNVLLGDAGLDLLVQATGLLPTSEVTSVPPALLTALQNLYASWDSDPFLLAERGGLPPIDLSDLALL